MIQVDQDQQRVCTKQRSPLSSVPSFICHSNIIVLQVLNQKQSRIQPPSCAVAISIQNRKISTSLSSSSAAVSAVATAVISMVKMEMETQTDQNGAE
mmetsp:Transcript_65577/g.73409  ORF Transcript_65577/g.73409 Transcript_65577/m.73409 type:complete len:97 (+) Transcript_65577:101-391(+)